MKGKTIDQLAIGDEASFTKTITEGDVYSFAGITGDFNPAHVNQTYAEASPFKTRIAHGMLSGSLFSTVLGTQLPGPGTIYLGQDLKFTKPVMFGDTITATVKIVEMVPEKGRVILETVATNQAGDVVVTGKATVLAPR